MKHKGLLAVFLLGFLTILFAPKNSFAAAWPQACTITTSPETVTTNERLINISINTNGNADPGTNYWVKLNNTVVQQVGEGGQNFRSQGGTITVNQVNEQGFLNVPETNQRKFQQKAYRVSVHNSGPGGEEKCSGSFEVQRSTVEGDKCSVTFTTEPPFFSGETDIGVKVDFKGNITDERNHHVRILQGSVLHREFHDANAKKTSELTAGTSIGTYETGNYRVEVTQSDCRGVPLCDEGWSCSNSFSIRSRDDGGGSVGCVPGTNTCSGGQFCNVDYTTGQASCQPFNAGVGKHVCDPANNENSALCKTAIGSINTDPERLVRRLLSLLLGLSGGIVLAIILYSGYMLMTSQGDAEKVKESRERLTSAIVGLLFIIFSLVILQFVTADVLSLPGFGG